MTGSASVAVVGAGVMGASVAYHLAARGVRDVLLLDRAPGPGLGSTGVATGGFRAQFASAVNVRLSLLSREKLLRFRDEVGVESGYVPAGYLWLAGSEGDLAALQAGLEVQWAEGLAEARLVDADGIAELNPAVRLAGVVGGAYCPSDGFLRPTQILEGYLAAARRLGARVKWGHDVTGVERSPDGSIRGLVARRGAIPTGAVVNAAGAWASGLARLAGVDLPVSPLRRQIAVTEPFPLLPEAMPMTIFTGDGFHLRVRDGRVLLLKPSPGAPGRPFDASVDPDWITEVTETARERVPVLRKATIDAASCRAGLYEMSPDRHAILGASSECPNFYLMNGSSGHGVMHAPALGQLLAEIIVEGAAKALDATPLRPSRFREESVLPASELL